MGYSAHLEIDAGGPEPAEVEDVGHVTSNLHRVFSFALGDTPITDLDRQPADEVALLASLAVAALRDPSNRAHIDSMLPSNGWGTYDNALEYMTKIRESCYRHPMATFRISR